ncbi:MAG TPA: magnesium transporter CorA family protein [Candidatus Bathyarchaeia archaeon]|nr:magnesium transporter CorA family protein [Candidatus Bathyarchaeia archaeon]
MQKKYEISGGKVVETRGDEATLLVFVGPDDTEKRYLVDHLKIDEHTLQSALDPDELSRLEFEPEHVALILKRPKNYSALEHFLFRVTSMGLFLFEDRLVVVVSEGDPLFEGKPFVAVHTLMDVLLRLLYQSIFHFLQHLKVINMVSEELEQKINASMENRYLLNLFALEKSLVYYLNAIHTNGVLISKLKNNAVKLKIANEQMEYLDDIVVENDQCYKLAEIYSNVLSSVMDARASIVNNNLNVLMKTLNIITIGIMVPTLVVSIFSMNVAIPMQRLGAAFWVIMTLAVGSAAVVMAVWRYKKFW